MEKKRAIDFHPKMSPSGWKYPKKFKLGLGRPWESSSSDCKADEGLEKKLLVGFHPVGGWNCPNEFKLGLGKPWESNNSHRDRHHRNLKKLAVIAK